MKREKFEVRKPLLGVKKVLKKPYFISAIAVCVVVACVTTTVCISATEKEGADVPGLSTEISEAPIETTIEVPTEAPAPVEEPTEEPVPVEEPTEEPVPVEEPTEEPVPVEEPTEEPAPVEEPTEALVEEPVEFNYIPRDSIIEGTPVDFTSNVIVSNSEPSNSRDYNNISVLSERTMLKVIRSTEEFEATLSVLKFISPTFKQIFMNTLEPEKYDDSFFLENALIIKLNGWANDIDSIVKNGNELCVEGIEYKYNYNYTPSDSSNPHILGEPVRYKYSLTEIKKSDLDGIDTVSFCYREVTVE